VAGIVGARFWEKSMPDAYRVTAHLQVIP